MAQVDAANGSSLTDVTHADLDADKTKKADRIPVKVSVSTDVAEDRLWIR